MSPAVSVLLPVRDGAEHLPEAIASLQAQTFDDFEVLAVDDGSTDATPELLAAWAAQDARVRVHRQEASGIVVALEAARSRARGRYLARMDADDVCDPSRLAEQLALMEDEPSVLVCGCRVEYFPDDELRDGARRYEEWLNAAVTSEAIERDIFVECPLAHPTFFMRASAVAAVGGYRDPGWPEDYDLLLRLWAEGGSADGGRAAASPVAADPTDAGAADRSRSNAGAADTERSGASPADAVPCRGLIAKVPATLLRWREGPDRLSRTHARYTPDAFLACKIHHLRRTLLRGERGAVVWGAGPVGKAAARALLQAGVRLVAFVEVDPRKIGQEIHGAPVLEAEEAVGIAGALHVGAVGQPGARERIRETVRDAGLRELRDFVAIA